MDSVDKMYKIKMENQVNNFVISILASFTENNNKLYDKFRLYINHKLDTIFQNYWG